MNPILLVAIGAAILALIFGKEKHNGQSAENDGGSDGGNHRGKPSNDSARNRRRNGDVVINAEHVTIDRTGSIKTKLKNKDKSNAKPDTDGASIPDMGNHRSSDDIPCELESDTKEPSQSVTTTQDPKQG